MSGFSVSSNSLDDLAARIAAVASRLDQLHDGRDQASGAVCDGHRVGPWQWEAFEKAASRLEEFLAHWSNGIASVGKNTSKVAELLTNAASAYRDTEASLTKAANPNP